MNLLVVPQILTWTAILALQSASASTCNKKFSVEQLRCFLGEDASFWQDQSHHILSLLTLTKDILVNICEMLWEQLQDKLVFIAGVLLTMFLLGYLLHRCCSHADGYRTLMNVQDELGIDELFKVRLGILQGAIFMAIDVTLDNVNGIIYFWRGLKVFGPLTLAIPVVSGFCCFVYKRNSWALAPSDHIDATGNDTFFFLQKRDRNGQLKPGLKSAILQMLQVEAFLTAYAAYKNPEKYEREWKVETAFNGVVEGFPSALLQTYTLFCMEHSHSLPGPFGTYINIVSILFSAYSIGKALNVISLELLPQTKVEPPLGGLKTTQLKMLQSLDVFARISVLAAIGISLRPAADMTVNCQFYLPTLMLLELLVIWTMSKWYFGWRSFFAADSILFTVLEYLSLPMLVGTGASLPQLLHIQLCTMTWRAMELAGGSILVWYSIHMNPQNPHRYVASFAVAGACAFFGAVTIIILDRRLRYFGEPLLPAANSKGYGKIHWASALNNQDLLRKIPYNELCHSDSEQSFAHVAAKHGQKEALQFFQEIVPETLKNADGNGDLPAHLAALNGHEGVVQFLHQVVPETLKTAAGDGELPAHFAALNGHEGVLKFLHQVVPETLKTADGNGALPAHVAALNGHEGVVPFLHQAVPETLKTADGNGALPAHFAAENGHEGLVQFLHQVVPETLKTASGNGDLPAHRAAGIGHEGVLKFLHQVVPDTLKTASGNGDLPAHLAAQYGHEGVLQFLHQVVPETLKTASGDGPLPAHLAALHGHEGVLQFLHQVVPETLKTAIENGHLPAHWAAQNGHEGVVQFLHQVVPETLKTAAGDGALPAHRAAGIGHEGVVQFLHQVVPETLKTADGNGDLPAHWAALNGHEGVVQFLHQVVPETLKTAAGDGALPAHWAALNGHEGVVQFLHQVVPETLKTAAGDEPLPAHCAAQNGHEGVLKFLHQVVPDTLKTASGNGDLPAHLAAENGHEGVLQFLHQVVPDTLKTAAKNGALPAHVAALNGHEGVVQFLHQVVPETLKTAAGDGALPAHFAALNGHEGVVQFLHQVVPETLTTASGNGTLPAHLAAENGHEGVVQFLHEVVSDTPAA